MSGSSALLVATGVEVLRVDIRGSEVERSRGLEEAHPTCLAADPRVRDRAWCGTGSRGVFRSDDGGASWRRVGLDREHVTAVAASPARPHEVWAGTEPSALWHSRDAGESWERKEGLLALPSSRAWSFPPRPDTHHVRWIACHPQSPDRLWLAIEAGALIATADGGATWRDRVPGGPYDTHELAVHPMRPDVLRASAGDGYYESPDGGSTWTSPMDGLGVGYLRSVAIDPGDPSIVVVSAASSPRTAYVAGRSDGRLYRREGGGRWRRVREGWPESPGTIAPLLCAGAEVGELWAAHERGVHRSADGGRRWKLVAAFEPHPSNLRGLALLTD
jgi:photosystem II stability/assembly factor-like uncharacterized protein